MGLLEEIFWTGVGLLVLTKEKVEEQIKEWEKKGVLSSKEAKEFVGKLSDKAEEFKKEIERRINEGIGKALERLNVPTRSDIEKLKARVKELEKKVKELTPET
ncbi:MAG: phasin family protein [bacterium]